MENISISLFQGYRDTVPTEVPFETIVEMIRSHRPTADHTERHRYYLERHLAKPAAGEKSSCPCFAVAVRFEGGRQKAHVCGFTGLCLADFDHIPEKDMKACMEKVRREAHTLLAYTTISGKGIRVICPYQAATPEDGRQPFYLHAQAFESINRHYAELLGCPYDAQCKNITRLSGLAHDPDVYFNPDAVPFRIETEKPRQRSSHSKRLARVLAAIRRRLADEGIEYAAHHHNEYIMRTGYLLNAYGISLQDATEWAVQQFADYDGDIAGVLRSCYRQTDEHGTLQLEPGLRRHKEKADESTVADIEAFLATQGQFRKNTVTNKCEIKPEGESEFQELTDRHVNTLWCRMGKQQKAVRIADMRAVLESEFTELYNPFEAYFKKLPAWDRQTDPIAALAAQVHVKDGADLFPLFFKKWLVAMTAALFDKEVVNHEILVLIGQQGIYKTTWLNNLLPDELRRYFYLKANSRNISKDDHLTLSEFAIVCLEELDEMDARELNQLKALTTTRHINERAAYAHYKEVRPHIASLCGTGNNVHFLTDLTGNRRWMPFEVESIDNPYEHPMDYEAVYAQAYALWKDGFRYWLEEEELQRLNEHNKYFEAPCLERELILTYYQRPLEGQECTFAANAQILMRINAGLKHKLSAVKVGIIMRQLGFTPIREGGKRGYKVIELTAEQIEMRRRALARYA